MHAIPKYTSPNSPKLMILTEVQKSWAAFGILPSLVSQPAWSGLKKTCVRSSAPSWTWNGSLLMLSNSLCETINRRICNRQAGNNYFLPQLLLLCFSLWLCLSLFPSLCLCVSQTLSLRLCLSDSLSLSGSLSGSVCLSVSLSLSLSLSHLPHSQHLRREVFAIINSSVHGDELFNRRLVLHIWIV